MMQGCKLETEDGKVVGIADESKDGRFEDTIVGNEEGIFEER